MPITFNTILRAAEFRLADVRLLRHKDSRAEKGRTPYELWRDEREKFDLYQSTQGVVHESKLNTLYWASFVGTNNDETLFVGMYRVKNRRLLKRDLPRPHGCIPVPARRKHSSLQIRRNPRLDGD